MSLSVKPARRRRQQIANSGNLDRNHPKKILPVMRVQSDQPLTHDVELAIHRLKPPLHPVKNPVLPLLQPLKRGHGRFGNMFQKCDTRFHSDVILGPLAENKQAYQVWHRPRIGVILLVESKQRMNRTQPTHHLHAMV